MFQHSDWPCDSLVYANLLFDTTALEKLAVLLSMDILHIAAVTVVDKLLAVFVHPKWMDAALLHFSLWCKVHLFF